MTTLMERALKSAQARDDARAEAREANKLQCRQKSHAGIISAASGRFELNINPDHVEDYGETGAQFDFALGDDLVLRFTASACRNFAATVTSAVTRVSDKPLFRNGVSIAEVNNLVALGDVLRKVEAG